MGVETRRPPLPAPTESSTLQTSGGSGEDADIATDISRRTDKTHYSIPEDGSPVQIPIKKRKDRNERGSSLPPDKSQTSLLIEYFEGAKGETPRARPSVRVKVTPSAARKIKDRNIDEHIQITETKGNRTPSYTRRIPIRPQSSEERKVSGSGDDKSISSYASAAEESSLANRKPPVEVEILDERDQGSDISGLSEGRTEQAREERYININPSDISSMPPDSMLEGKEGTVTPKRTRSRSTSREAVVTDTLKTPSRRRSRSLSQERIAHKAAEKIAGKSRAVSGGKHRVTSKTRNRSISSEQLEGEPKSGRRKSSKKHREEDVRSGGDSSVLTTSDRGDQYSYRSGTSRSSINTNPKLLETVENAIRRLIMPEIENIKQEQRMQESRRTSTASASSRGDLGRRLSKHASAPDITNKPKVYLNKDENHAGTLLSGDSVKGKKENRRQRKPDSPSDRRFEREISEETVIRDDGKSSRKGSERRLRNAAAAGIAGGILTATALGHHDLKHRESQSSDDRRRRRRRSSKSHSRSASNAESTDDAFYKYEVPPMPLQSDIHSSEVTRDSLLSEQTEGTLSPSEEKIHTAEIRRVARGSPREILSPSHRTPTRSPRTKQRELGAQRSHSPHEQMEETGSPRSQRSAKIRDEHHSKMAEAGVLGAVAGVGVHTARRLAERQDQYDSSEEYAYQHDPQGLSPIQSVSSRQGSELNRESFLQRSSAASLSNRRKEGERTSSASPKSPVSVDMTRHRPKGINYEPPEDVIEQLRDSRYTEGAYSDQDPAMDQWFEHEHEKNESLRESMTDYNRMTSYTDDSLDASYHDKLNAGQIPQNVGTARNPDYVHTPFAVESAVASLIDTSTTSARSRHEKELEEPLQSEQVEGWERNLAQKPMSSERLSPRKDKSTPLSESRDMEPLSAQSSPRQSVAESVNKEDEHVPMLSTGVPDQNDPMPEIGHGLHSDSDISTNPSIIQGPMGGYRAEDLDNWSNQPTSPQPKQRKDSSAQENLKAAAAGFLGAAALASSRNNSPEKQDQSKELSIKEIYHPQDEAIFESSARHNLEQAPRDSYLSEYTAASPPKDEGYQSGNQPGPQSPEISFNDAKGFNDVNEEDPFVGPGHTRHLSTASHGMAHGMGSPMYDSVTGNGIDRIQSKDIVALMDHLTVRDAQRSARDTEILVTLVRSAAEMRNSFEEMKRFIAEQDDILVEASNKQHDRTIQKIVLGGPRPQPTSKSSFTRRSASDEIEDAQQKKRNIFRRALKGLSTRNQNDISKIEEMLEHLLGEVEGLKHAQDDRPTMSNTRAQSLDSYRILRAAGPDGYEPEGRAGTGSTGHSGYFSNSPSREGSAMRNRDLRRESQNRVSTVLEADEELEANEQNVLDNQFENNDELLTPTQENHRAGSVPLGTPPPHVPLPTGALSNENTPRTGTDKSRKHKSSSSSFFPKISRWSKTTASSMGDNIRNSGRKERPFSEASRSGELHNYDGNDHYDPQGDDRIRSNGSIENLEAKDMVPENNRPQSPLIPSQVSEAPKYEAHRNSLNLQHPQPRPGPTHRFQHHLEDQAQNFSGTRSPITPTSDSFGSDPTLARYIPIQSNRYSGNTGNLSPISDAGYSETSAANEAKAPPRPPKVKDDGPLIPSPGPSKVPKGVQDNRPSISSPLSTERLQPAQRYNGAPGGREPSKDSPRSSSGATPMRKPTGPRPITSSGSYSPEKDGVKRTRYRGSPNALPSSTEDVTF